ncbi:hypothetical protein DFH06DRAFT_1132448 [Mycena polygramma]|nr:hypothetical protein DFH06DRAFT_1132448 [Mycena polygramma]
MSDPMQTRLQGLSLWHSISRLFDHLFEGAPLGWWGPKLVLLTSDQETRPTHNSGSLDGDIRKDEEPFSKLHDLPIELLLLVFAFAMPPFTPPSGFLGLREGPWALSAVCHGWRTLVLSQPSFWNFVFLDFAADDPESPSFAEMEPKLILLLARSAQSPLHIIFRTSFFTDRERRSLDLVALHCERWGTLTFTGPPVLYFRLDAVRNRLPLLRALDIRVHQEYLDTSAPAPRYAMFVACPSLRAVSVNAGRGGARPLLVDLPFAQLRYYSASNPWDAHAHALRAASSLTDCVLHITGVSESTPSADGGPIILPRLRRLCVSRTDVLDFMETPALRELYCCSPSTHLYAFLARATGLQKLFVASPEADIAALLRGAGTIPDIHLCLYIPASAASDLFSLLSQIPVPGLRALSICLAPDGHPSFTLDEAQLMQTVDSLSQDGALCSFKLSGANLILSVATLAWMERLRGLGMEMVVSPGASSGMVPEDFRLMVSPSMQKR